MSWLKKSLRTKDARQANIKAKPVLMAFDSVLARAAGLLLNTPTRTHLSEREIERMAQYQFASMLEEDEATGSEELFQSIGGSFRKQASPVRRSLR